MFKITGTATEHSPRAVDFDTLEFVTEFEAEEYLKFSVLPPDFIFENKKYYLDKDKDWYFQIEGNRDWSFDSINPCKPESGELGYKIDEWVRHAHWHFKKFVSPKVNCYCCREVNYRLLKYGLMLATIPFLPSFITFSVGFVLVMIAFISRLVL